MSAFAEAERRAYSCRISKSRQYCTVGILYSAVHKLRPLLTFTMPYTLWLCVLVHVLLVNLGLDFWLYTISEQWWLIVCTRNLFFRIFFVQYCLFFILFMAGDKQCRHFVGDIQCRHFVGDKQCRHFVGDKQCRHFVSDKQCRHFVGDKQCRHFVGIGFSLFLTVHSKLFQFTFGNVLNFV